MVAVLKSSMADISSSSPEDVTEGARRATGDTSSGAATPDPEVAASAKRRQFPAAEKRRIVAEAARCNKPGELGALLRREGIYSSMLSTWRKQIAAAERTALAPRKRGPRKFTKYLGRSPDAATVEDLRNYLPVGCGTAPTVADRPILLKNSFPGSKGPTACLR